MGVHAVVVGATGLVGRALVSELLADARFDRVTALARRPTGIGSPKLSESIGDLAALAPARVPEGAIAMCALGTTIRDAGSPAAFRAVDHGLVLRFAEACRARGSPAFHVVSSMGADARSRALYPRTKGEVERDLAALGFPRLCIYRPSLLLGDRPDPRRGERALSALLRGASGLLVGPLAPWRAIPAAVVARAIARHALDDERGTHVLRSDAIARLGA